MLTPSCDVIGHRISESLDRKLTFRERMSIKIHTMGCVLCERYRHQMLAVHTILSKYVMEMEKNEDLTTPLPEEAKERIKAVLKNEAS